MLESVNMNQGTWWDTWNCEHMLLAWNADVSCEIKGEVSL